MGFMAGFGSAFADSFNADQQIKAQQKQDMFRLQYQDYISRRDKQDQIDMENKKNAKLAKQLVANTGQPAEAWTSAYDLLSGGASPEYVAKMLTENQAVVEHNSNTTKPGEGATASDAQPADPRDSLTSGAQSSVDAQMAASGMKTPEQGDQSLFGDVMGGVKQALGGNSQARIQRDSQRAQEKVAGAAGVPVEQVQKTLGGNGHVPGEPIDGMPDANIKWQPKTESFEAKSKAVNNLGDAVALDQWTKHNGTPEQQAYSKELLDRYTGLRDETIRNTAIANGTGFLIQRAAIRGPGGKGWRGDFAYADYSKDPNNPVYRDKDGKEIPIEQLAPVGKDQEADMKAVADEGSEALKPYQQAVVDQKNFIRTAHNYIQLLKGPDGKYNGQTIDIAGDLQQFADRWRRAGINIADVLFPKGNIEDASAAINELDSVEKNLRKQLDSGKIVDRVQENAMRASLIDIQGTKLAYQMAAAANGSTKGISNQDFNNYKSVVSGNGNPATAAKALQMSILQNNKNIGSMEQEVKKGKGKSSYYAGRYQGAPNGFDMGKSFDEDIASDPEMTEAMKNISSDASLEDNPGQQVNTDMTDAPDWAKKSDKPIIGLSGNEISPEQWKYMSPALQEAIRKKNGL